MPAKDLKVQIAGDETQLNRALDRAEGRLTKYTASVVRQSDMQAAAYRKVGEQSAYAGAQAGGWAAKQEAAARRAAASTSAMLAEHGAALQKLGDRTMATGRAVSSVGSSILGVVAPIDAAGFAAGKLAVDFSRAMEMLHTQANYSQKDVERLSKAVLELSPKVGASPKELAEGLYHVASAGFDASKSMEIVKEAMMGARLGLASADETTYALVSVMRSAPKDIKSAADAMGLMNSVVGQGDMRMQQLVDALSTGIVPAAKAAGLGFRDVGAALDILTARGIPAQMGATRLRQTFAFMEKQSSTAKKALAEIGITSGELGAELQKPNGLLKAVELLKTHLEGSGKSVAEQNRVLLSAFGGGRSSAAIQTLVQNVGELRERYRTLPEAAKAVQHLNDVWRDFQKTPAQQLAEVQQKVNVSLIELGDQILPAALPIIKELGNTVGKAAEDFEHLSSGQKQAIVDLALAGTAIGLLAKPIGGIITTVGFVGKSFGLAEAGASKFVGVFGTAVEETVPVAARSGAAAGTAYSTAFAAAAARGVEGSAAMGAAEFGPYATPFGRTRAPGFGARAGTPGLGPAGFSAADQLLMAGGPAAGGVPLAAKARAFGGNLMKGGMIGLGGLFAGEIAGAAIPGHGGDIAKGLIKDTAFGAAIGTAIAPGVGTAIGGGLGLIAGALKQFTHGKSEEDAHNLTHIPGAHSHGGVEPTIDAINKREAEELAHLPQIRHSAAGRSVTVTTGREPNARERARAQQIKDEREEERAEALGKDQAHYLVHGPTKNPGIESIIRNTHKELSVLKPAAQQAFMGFITTAVETLEHNGHLAKGSLKKLMESLQPVLQPFAPKGAQVAKDFSNQFISNIKTRDMLGKMSSTAKDINKNWATEFGLLPVSTHMTITEATRNANHDLGVLQHIMRTGTGQQRKEAEEEWKQLAPKLHGYLQAATDKTKSDLAVIAHQAGPLSKQGVSAILSEWQALPPSMKTQLDHAGGAVAAGIKRINSMLRTELQGLGISGKQISSFIGSSTEGLASAATNPGTTENLIHQSEGVTGRAVGGYLGNPGERGRDEVLIKAGRGEAIVNSAQQPYTEMGLAVTKAMGMQPYGSLGELFANVRTPHHMAGGGFAGMVAEANNITGHRYPYKWGGGHDSGFTGPYDCSGAVSAVLHAGGILSEPRVAGGFESFGQPGPGKVTLFVNDNTHVYMRMGGRYFGTSMSNPGGGAAWFAGGPRAGFAERHVPDGMVAGGGLVSTPSWTGPGGVFGAMGRGALSIVARAANKSAEGMSFAGQIGGGNPGDAGIAHHAGGGFVSTAYGPPWEGIEGTGQTATGIDLHKHGKGDYPHKYIVAVDPSVIPLGSQLKVWPNPFGYAGNFLAADTGGAIKGNRIDFYDWRGRSLQNAWGRRNVTVTVGGSVTGGRTKKAAAGLHLTGGQEGHIRDLTGGAEGLKAAETTRATWAGEIAGALETHQARWNATPRDLTSAAGQHAATLDAEQVVKSDKDQLRFYQDELKLLQKEAKQWGKLRDYFRHLARRKHGTAKKQALDKAATYAAKVHTAENDARALKGTIYSAETKVIEAETAETALAGEITTASADAAAAAAAHTAEVLSGDMNAYQAALSHIDLLERAGELDPGKAKSAREEAAKRALAGGFGELSPDDILKIKGDLREFAKATADATAALEAHTQALQDSAKALNEFTHAGERLSEVENATLLKAIADMVSGQIGGMDYQSRQSTPGTGQAARY